MKRSAACKAIYAKGAVNVGDLMIYADCSEGYAQALLKKLCDDRYLERTGTVEDSLGKRRIAYRLRCRDRFYSEQIIIRPAPKAGTQIKRILAEIRRRHKPFTVKEIADAVPVTTNYADRVLRKLAAEGKVLLQGTVTAAHTRRPVKQYKRK